MPRHEAPITRRGALCGVAVTVLAAKSINGVLGQMTASTDKVPTPFWVAVEQGKLDAIVRRVREFPWGAFTVPPGADEWRYGPSPAFMRELCAHWIERYDWRGQEAAINAVPQFTTQVSGASLHFVHERGSGPSPRPLLIVPGWPYSFHSYSNTVERLAHPERFGGRVEDAFSVVIPSIPGFGFSGRPAAPMGPRRVAELFDNLMVGTLGYERYMAHGGDWGAPIVDFLGFSRPEHITGVHLTMVLVRADGAPALSGKMAPGASEAEQAFAGAEIAVWVKEGAYAQLAATKPLSPAYAMADSPVGIAAWIVEAFHAWSDRREQPFEALFSHDQLLTEVMLYLVSGSFGTSTWIDAADEQEQFYTVPLGKRIEVPVGIAAFPDPVFLPVPREIAEKSHNVVHYTVMPRGGHFPFYEVPELLVDDLRKFATAIAPQNDR